MKRPYGEPRKNPELTTEEKADHAISVYDYPDLDLDENEYILIDVERTKLLPILAHAVAILGYLFFATIAFFDMSGLFGMSSQGLFSLVCLLVTALLAIICYAAVWIYNRNKMIVSNQRIFNKVQQALFSFRMQSIELEHIEDISYAQVGIRANLFDYGSIRFSTVGNEHTYELTFVDNPKSQINIIKKAVHDVDEGEATKFRAKNAD
jgi:predicted membrane protein